LYLHAIRCATFPEQEDWFAWYSSLHRTCTRYSSLACCTNSHKLCAYSLCVSLRFSFKICQHLSVKSPSLLVQVQCTKAMYVIEV
jgi:hypothetical protein